MKSILLPGCAVVAMTSFVTGAFAGDTKIPAGVFINQQTTDQYLARDNLLGAKVHGPDGKVIGDIEDLIINEYNLITGVVVGTGGFMGIAEKKIGVTVSSLKFDDAAGKTIITLPEGTPEVLAVVEAYKPTQPRKSVMERAQEKAQELTDKATQSAKAASENARPAISDAVVKSHEAYAKAKEAAAPAIEAAKEAVNSAIDKASEAVDGMSK